MFSETFTLALAGGFLLTPLYRRHKWFRLLAQSKSSFADHSEHSCLARSLCVIAREDGAAAIPDLVTDHSWRSCFSMAPSFSSLARCRVVAITCCKLCHLPPQALNSPHYALVSCPVFQRLNCPSKRHRSFCSVAKALVMCPTV